MPKPNTIRYAEPYIDDSGDRMIALYSRDRDGKERIELHLNSERIVVEDFADFDWLAERVKEIRAHVKA